MAKTAKHIIFKGRVQGVGFRYTAHQTASRYDLTGYVRNLPDGTVEALMQGTKASVQACLDSIQNTFGGYLLEFDATDRPVDPRYHDFRITY